jgi:hypothetical protein
MTASRRYSVLGRLVWQIGSRVAKKKVKTNRTKLGAAAVVAAALTAGVFAVRASD